MPGSTILEVVNYGLVLVFGLFLSVDLAGGWENRKQKRIVFLLCLVLLAVQAICSFLWGVDWTQKLYPLLTHLPVLLILTFVLKKRIGLSVVSLCIAYLCCQLPRWVKITIVGLNGSDLVGEIGYTLSIIASFYLLQRYFVRAAHDAITYSPQSLFLFGSLPAAYYMFDYATTVYSDALYEGIKALNEFLPTALIIFYVVFLAAYHVQIQKRMEIGAQKSVLEAKLKQSKTELDGMRSVEAKTMVYRHDMRHNLNMIEGFLKTGKPEKAEEFIKTILNELDMIKLKRFCENDTVNLLCTSFSDKAEHMGARLVMKLELPKELAILDTELCAVISNGLENALNAVSGLEESSKWIRFYCGVRMNNLLIEIQNPYSGKIAMRNGMPVTKQAGHGYGCRSIRAIAEKKHGMYSFEPNSGIFTLRVALPLGIGKTTGVK